METAEDCVWGKKDVTRFCFFIDLHEEGALKNDNGISSYQGAVKDRDAMNQIITVDRSD